ncbi:hypothetical protein L1887_11656 [Cichorium endivia]|nr:hypothetical protein L1887_11656 [Cichorium endivia]
MNIGSRGIIHLGGIRTSRFRIILVSVITVCIYRDTYWVQSFRVSINYAHGRWKRGDRKSISFLPDLPWSPTARQNDNIIIHRS